MKHGKFKSNLRLLTYHPLVFARVYRWELSFLFVGAAGDAATTAVLLHKFGAEVELHPVVRVDSAPLRHTLPAGRCLQPLYTALVLNPFFKKMGAAPI
jgi:hypothetical protein